MDLTNQVVTHEKYGEGIISSVGKQYITILFQHEELQFQYPAAFKQKLALKDDSCSAYVQTEISAMEAKAVESAEEKRLNNILSDFIYASNTVDFVSEHPLELIQVILKHRVGSHPGIDAEEKAFRRLCRLCRGRLPQGDVSDEGRVLKQEGSEGISAGHDFPLLSFRNFRYNRVCASLFYNFRCSIPRNADSFCPV